MSKSTSKDSPEHCQMRNSFSFFVSLTLESMGSMDTHETMEAESTRPKGSTPSSSTHVGRRCTLSAALKMGFFGTSIGSQKSALILHLFRSRIFSVPRGAIIVKGKIVVEFGP